MTPIVLFIILSIIYALGGDTSGIEAIGKIIIFIVLFLIVGSILAYAPWLAIIVVIGFVIWSCCNN